MSSKNKHNVNEILARLKYVFHVNTNLELSKILAVQPQTISMWKKRDSIDLSMLIEICYNHNVNADWLFLNRGQCGLREDKNDSKYKIVKMLESMTEEQRRDVLKYTEKEKLFEELIQNRKTA